MDSYTKVDLRTVSFDVPPQDVRWGCKTVCGTLFLKEEEEVKGEGGGGE